jgi:hypothetical protein
MPMQQKAGKPCTIDDRDFEWETPVWHAFSVVHAGSWRRPMHCLATDSPFSFVPRSWNDWLLCQRQKPPIQPRKLIVSKWRFFECHVFIHFTWKINSTHVWINLRWIKEYRPCFCWNNIMPTWFGGICGRKSHACSPRLHSDTTAPSPCNVSPWFLSE